MVADSFEGAVPEDSESPTKKFALGVLLVHGIGQQPASDTLVRWTDILIGVIRRATKNAVSVSVLSATTRGSGRNEQAEAVIRLRSEGPNDEKWLIAEGWWAQSFLAPSYGELVSWSVRALPWAAALYIAQGLASAVPAPRWSEAWLLGITRAVLQLLVIFALTPFFIAGLAVVLVLGWLPIAQLRALMLSAQSLLTASVGDSLAFVESPIRAAFIRTRILQALERLERDCKRTIVVAHSQGAAAVLDALGGIREPSAKQEASDVTAVPNTLVTFGAGTNQLASLKLLSSGKASKDGTNPVYLALGAVSALIGILAWFAFSATSALSIGKAVLLLTATAAVVSLLFIGSKRLIDRLAARFDSVKARTDKILPWAGVLSTVAVLIPAVIVAERSEVPMFLASILLIALLFLVGCIVRILSPEFLDEVKGTVVRPSGLEKWIDIYASADPVPNGRTRTNDPLTSYPIWNRDSAFSDHTTYWNNLDGFVQRVARICAETAESGWRGALPPATELVDERAKWRVGFLRTFRRAAVAGWIFLFVVLWYLYGAELPVPFESPAWIPETGRTMMRALVLAVLLVVVGRVGNRVILWPWYRWERKEQQEFLSHKPPAVEPLWYVGLMASFIALLLTLDVVLATHAWRGSQGPLRVDDIGEVLAPLLGWVIIGAWLMLWLRPAPPWNDNAEELKSARAAHAQSRRRRVLRTSLAGFWLCAVLGILLSGAELRDAYVEPIGHLSKELKSTAHGRVIAFERSSPGERELVRLWTLALPESEAESLRKLCKKTGTLDFNGRVEKLLADDHRRVDYGVQAPSFSMGCYIAESQRVEENVRISSEILLGGRLLQLKSTRFLEAK